MTYIFRGKVIGSDQWVYGNLLQRVDSLGPLSLIEVQDKETFEIETFHVYPESVGMWTGLKDKAGKEIYQGDVYLAERGHMRSRGYKRKGYPETIKVTCIVEWSVYDAGWNGREVSPIIEHIEFDKNATYHYIFTSLSGSQNGHADWVEIIGNIHEHPHLLNPAQGAVINTMNNIDPNEKQATEEQVAAVEQEAQEQAMESAEGGGSEG